MYLNLLFSLTEICLYSFDDVYTETKREIIENQTKKYLKKSIRKCWRRDI